ncbi:hypothetical protein BRARA_I01457 [Brassica rapa]|uniref:Uncharacterized protein n=1 Tax=Brassica campestris TaxID=3711 RepID=A0A397XUE8_BRACM|nr:hypothetical protein BRARA_I01457 [Brassica rapa]
MKIYSIPAKLDISELLINSYATKLSAFWRHDSQSPPRNITSTSFQWYDALKQKQKATHQNIHFEQSAVLSIPSISASNHQLQTSVPKLNRRRAERDTTVCLNVFKGSARILHKKLEPTRFLYLSLRLGVLRVSLHCHCRGCEVPVIVVDHNTPNWRSDAYIEWKIFHYFIIKQNKTKLEKFWVREYEKKAKLSNLMDVQRKEYHEKHLQSIHQAIKEDGGWCSEKYESYEFMIKRYLRISFSGQYTVELYPYWFGHYRQELERETAIAGELSTSTSSPDQEVLVGEPLEAAGLLKHRGGTREVRRVCQRRAASDITRKPYED